MKKKFLILFLFTILILNGCYENKSPTKYQIAISSSGVAYRLNVITGDVWLITSNGLIKMLKNQKNKEITLIVGNHYNTEDSTHFKYLGKGQLQYYETKEQRIQRFIKFNTI